MKLQRLTFACGVVCLVAALGGPTLTRGAEIQVDRAQYFSPRLLGMGGAFTAVSDDRNLFFMNPAGLAYARRSIGFEFLPVNINNNSISALNFYSDNNDTIDNLDNLSDEDQAAFFDDLLGEIGGKTSRASAHFPLWVTLPAQGGGMPHLGFGFFARGSTDALAINGASGVPVASLGLDVQYTGIASAAYSWADVLPGLLSLGGSLKIDHRQVSLTSKSLLAISSNEDIDFLSDTVFGVDLGALYEVTPHLRVGVSVFDLLSNDFRFGGQDNPDPLDILNENDVGNLSPRWNLGVAWFTDRQAGPLTNSTLALDIREPGRVRQAFWSSIYMGAESHLSVLALRAGFYQGYPGAGLGIGPLQYAYFSNELGNHPGGRSNYQHALSLAFRFGI